MAWNSKKHESVKHTVLQLKDKETRTHYIDTWITGYTLDSDQYAKAEADQVRGKAKQSIIVEKGRQKIEIDSDAGEKRRDLLVSMITSLREGDEYEEDIDDVKRQLKTNRAVNWIYEQWADHMDDRSNFLEAPVPKPKSTSKA